MERKMCVSGYFLILYRLSLVSPNPLPLSILYITFYIVKMQVSVEHVLFSSRNAVTPNNVIDKILRNFDKSLEERQNLEFKKLRFFTIFSPRHLSYLPLPDNFSSSLNLAKGKLVGLNTLVREDDVSIEDRYSSFETIVN